MNRDLRMSRIAATEALIFSTVAFVAADSCLDRCQNQMQSGHDNHVDIQIYHLHLHLNDALVASYLVAQF